MESFVINTSSGTPLHYYRWLPEAPCVATIQIAHGMGEHAARYDWVARELNASGYAVFADDHRGHGRTAAADGLGDLGEDGWNRAIRDAHDLHLAIAAQFPDVPHVLLGHSMGAMLTQQYLYRHANGLSAAVISGSPGFGGAFQLWLSHTIARFERWRHGATGESPLLQKMIFGDANKSFDGPEATGFEWLSRDSDQVQHYVDDPFCGFVLRSGSLADLFAGAREARRRESVSRIPGGLPVYVFSGADDPVHGEQKGLERLLDAYGGQLENVTSRIYPGGRHEMMNETNRQEVVDDLRRWLADTLG